MVQLDEGEYVRVVQVMDRSDIYIKKDMLEEIEKLIYLALHYRGVEKKG